MALDNSLRNFYESLRFHSEVKAAIFADDITTVALNAIAHDKSKGQPAATRLREKAVQYDLPEALRRVLNAALDDLGYS
jgi:hypothetical protein